MKGKLLRAVSTLSGTIIGVGFFSLPYILSQVGILAMTLNFLFLGSIVILIHQFFGELSLTTPDLKRMPGFARHYLGKWGERVAFISAILGFYGSLLAYLILGSQFLKNLFSQFFYLPEIFYPLIYFALGLIFIYLDISVVSKIEFLDVFLFSLILILILIFGKNFINFDNFSNFEFRISNLFLPWGPILFSLWGAAIIPEIEEILGDEKKFLKKAIFFAILTSAIFYFLFSIVIFGICGKNTSEDSISGLKIYFDKNIVSFFYFFGLVTTFTSFVALGLTMEKIFWYDFKLNKNLAFFLACFPPLFLFFLGFNKFLPVISFVGGVMLGIDGILILLMYKKQFKTQISKFKISLVYFLIFLLIVGIFYEIIYFKR